MKQRYTITVADMELSIISDASPDEVESLVGMLDRRMRDINLKSPRCTKNEAAILCALSYCSERIAMQEAFKKVEKDSFRFAAENEKLKKTVETMQAQMDELRKDAEVMRSILDRAAQSSVQTAAPKTPVAKPEEEGTQITIESIPEQFAETTEVADAVPAIASEKNGKPANKSRVGTMFDLLTFSDI